MIIELSMILERENFRNIMSIANSRNKYLVENDDEYIDSLFAAKGITVIYRDSQYKKKVKLVVNLGMVEKSGMSDSKKLIRKLEKRIDEYFNHKYRLDDFTLSGVVLSMDIDVGNHENVSAYIKVLQRIGKVKGFSPVNYDCFDEETSFCLDGNSNGVGFMIYDLKRLISRQMENVGTKRKKIESVTTDAEGILRAEVRLTKPKAIRMYTSELDVTGQIVELSEKSKDIFYDIFTRVVPFGDYYKKNRAEEIIRAQVTDRVMRRKMIRLLTLIPEKKSLYLAQKAMNCRDIEKVMDAFAKINVSPVTISKRHNVKFLKCLYEYLCEERNGSYY